MRDMKIVRFKNIASTNLYALENFASLEDKTVVFAETQSSGRGRKGRSWLSDTPGNIFISVVLKEGIDHKNAANVTQVAALAVTEYLKSIGIKALIKWPNDVLCGNKKICGILSEGVIRSSRMQGVVLGIGLNVNLPMEKLQKIDKPATSVLAEKGLKYDVESVLNDLLGFFYKKFKIFVEKEFAFMLGEWSENFIGTGKLIRISDSDNSILAKCDGINPDGTLRVLTEDGIQTIFSGDIEILDQSS